MAIEIGQQLGSYEITSLLGKGGMGEVYRARDNKLKRDVAIKVLPDEFSNDKERLSRFQREAEVLASLNHTSLAAIYDLQESSNLRFLVLELVEGETLAERIQRGPIPVDEALDIAQQICDALEAAHERGIIHRDLKPANIKIGPNGQVKVLDFGLAKVWEHSGSAANLSNSPTLATISSMPGAIIGTAAYMAPEQAKGKPTDKRADIWAFGVVLVEMLTGASVYTGETVSEVLAAVIMKEPDLKTLPASLPPSVAHLIGRCLEKDPKRRLRDIGEARLILTHPTVTAPVAVPSVAAASPAKRNPWMIGAVAGAFVLAAAAITFLWITRNTTVLPVVRYDVIPPAKTTLDLFSRPALALSPDGSKLVFVAVEEGIDRLYMRKRDEAEAKAIPGTEGATEPEFSPDGRSVAFFAGGALRKVSLDGAMTSLAKVAETRGLTWIDSSTLVYTPDTETALFEVSANGGEPKAISKIEAGKGERTHRWPYALPGGKAVLFTVGNLASPDDYDSSNVEVVILATGERRMVLQGASRASYAAGYLIFGRGGSIHAVAFDPNSLKTTGPSLPVVQGVAGDRTTGAVHFSIANDGTLAYTPGGAGNEYEMVWMDRAGKIELIDTPHGLYMDPNISPDGTKAAVTLVKSGDSNNYDVWIYDFIRKTFTRLTFAGMNETPVWSADGKSIFYSSLALSGDKTTIFRKPADGSREAEEVVTLDWRVYLRGVFPDGTALVNVVSGKSADIFRIELKAGAKPVPIVTSAFNEFGPSASPNGRFVAYDSDDSGRTEVYVRDLSQSGGRWQISTLGGQEPYWAPDGRELYFRNNDRLMVAAVDARTAFQAEAPRVLAQNIPNLRLASDVTYAPDPKRSRFLLLRPANGDFTSRPVRIVLHWFSDLRASFQSH